MKYFLLFSSLLLKRGICSEECIPNIAIIGGGIGGASASHFLGELFDSRLKIDLYEAKSLGGRLATVQMDGNTYEAGGSIIHPSNKYMQDFTKLLGLEHTPPSNNQKLGIWNGKEFIFVESEWEAINFAKLVYRYGIQPFKYNRYINSIISDFAKIYALQDAKKSFMNVTGLLAAMNADFPKFLQVPIKDHLLSLGYADRFIDELVKSTLVVNYGQDTNVQSFVAYISSAGIGSNLWSVKGGNKKVPEHLIYRNGNVSVIPSQVRTIRHLSTKNNTLYEVQYTNKDSTTVMKSVYDIVILATPQTHDQKFPISFDGFQDNDFQFNGEYHKTIATFVKADLKPHYFGLEEQIDAVISCDSNATIINSIGRLTSVEGPTEEDHRIWKIFSNEPLKPELINKMFENVDDVKQITWKAYPQYSGNTRLEKFKLHDALYHVNAVEWAASAMEMSAISGRNVAILAYKDFTQKYTVKKVQEDKIERTLSGEL